MRTRFFAGAILLAASILSLTLATQAVAQSSSSAPQAGNPAPNDTTLSEIIVTADKRSERLNDVPMSISAVSGDQLIKQGITEVADLAKVAPGFTYQPSQYGTPVFFIRGVGFLDVATSAPPAVSVYLDQVPLPYSVMAEGMALDLERVEILKGPQGTLFGENSTGGAINFIPAKPTPVFAAGASIGAGNFNAYNANGFVSGPLTNTLAARFAVSTEQRGDWQQSETRDDNAGQRNFSTGRALLDWKPQDDLRFELNVNGWLDKSDTQAAQFVAFAPLSPNGYPTPVLAAYKPAPNNNRIADWDPDFSLRRDDHFYQTSLRGDWDILPSVTVTSLSSYSNINQDAPNDTDGTPYLNESYTLFTKIRALSQELRVSGDAFSDKLKWMIGGNYEHDSTEDYQLAQYHLGSDTGVGALRFYSSGVVDDQEINTYAGFGSLDYTLPQNVTASASVRYTSRDDDFHGCLKDTGPGSGLAAAFSQIAASPIPVGGCVTLNNDLMAGIVEKSADQDNVSWRVGLSWRPDSDSLLYGNVTKGYKAGTFPTVPGLFTPQLDFISQESVLAYEVGFKQELLSETLQVSGAAFYYDYTDKQLIGYITTAFGNLPGLVSIPKSRINGGEVDITWKPAKGWLISAGATYVGSRIESSFVGNDPFGNVVDTRGDSFPSTPDWQLTGDAEYDFPLTDSLNGYVGVSPRYRSRTEAAFGASPVFEIGAYGLLDLRGGVATPDGHWRAEIWGHNVTDRFYLTNITHISDTVDRITGMPGTYGITFTYRY